MPAPIPSRDIEDRLLGWVEALERVVTEVRQVQESIRSGDDSPAGELPGPTSHPGSTDES